MSDVPDLLWFNQTVCRSAGLLLFLPSMKSPLLAGCLFMSRYHCPYPPTAAHLCSKSANNSKPPLSCWFPQSTLKWIQLMCIDASEWEAKTPLPEDQVCSDNSVWNSTGCKLTSQLLLTGENALTRWFTLCNSLFCTSTTNQVDTGSTVCESVVWSHNV